MQLLTLVSCLGVSAFVATRIDARPFEACRLVPQRSLLLLHVERDTLLPHADADAEWMSASSVRPGPTDSLLATPGTEMPGARVRLVRVDSTTRQALRQAGIHDPHPSAFIRAAPYRADCRTIRWTSSRPWVVRGDTGYARATLTPREQWIGGIPVFVIRNIWSYPYPRQRSLPLDVPPDTPVASASALFDLNATLEAAAPLWNESMLTSDTAHRARALEWARSHPIDADRPPLRQLVRQAALGADWERVQRIRSRLRGSYEVILETEGQRATWYFRTHDRPGYSWREGDTASTTAQLLASPHAAGYRLVGYAAPSREALDTLFPRVRRETPLVWLAVADRPTVEGNDSRTVLHGELEFRMLAAPASLWDALDAFVKPLSRTDSLVSQRMPEIGARSNRQPRFPIVVRLDALGNVRADTSLTSDGRAVRVSLRRLDTISVPRPF